MSDWIPQPEERHVHIAAQLEAHLARIRELVARNPPMPRLHELFRFSTADATCVNCGYTLASHEDEEQWCPEGNGRWIPE